MTQGQSFPEGLETKIKAEAYRLGFSLAGITSSAPLENYRIYEDWFAKGHHAGMGYLTSEYHRQARRNPLRLMPEVRSIICLGYSYPMHAIEELTKKDTALIAGYASGNDYHFILPKKMESLVNFIKEICGQSLIYKTYTDSAPILERELASRAGLGWIGKNSCLLSPAAGSGFLLSELFLDLELTPDSPFTTDLCGTCQRCLQACPTHCIEDNRTVDANRCISYHTIENKHQIPPEIAGSMGNWLFGCDVCQMVCPWNKKSLVITPKTEYTSQQLDAILEMNALRFKSTFADSAISRAKYFGLVRNALIVLAGMDEIISGPIIKRFKSKCMDPELLATANWALAKMTKESPL